MKHIVRCQAGNALSYSEYGDPNGYPILIHHGLIASISNHHLFDSLVAAGSRLICIARPGYGESSSYLMKNLAEWGELVSVLVDELALGEFDILGMSSGAPYSYAVGYKLPNRVRSIYIFSGTPALYHPRVLEFWPYLVTRNASIAEMRQVAKDVFFSHITEEDRLKEDIQDSMANDCFGVAQDLCLRCMDWGFTLSDVTAMVYMQHSKTDGDVPFIAAELTANLIPKCQLATREGDHFSAAA